MHSLVLWITLQDVLKFGFSSREYVLLHEKTKGSEADDDIDDVAEPAKQDASQLYGRTTISGMYGTCIADLGAGIHWIWLDKSDDSGHKID